MFCFGEFFERGKRLIPQLHKVVPQPRQALGVQFVNPPRARAAVAHQSRILQDPQVLRNGRPRYRQARGKLVHRLGVVAQHFKDCQPGRVAQRGQPILYVSIHLR